MSNSKCSDGLKEMNKIQYNFFFLIKDNGNLVHRVHYQHDNQTIIKTKEIILLT